MLRQAGQTLDFDKPIAVMLLGLLGHMVDDAQAQAIADALVAALPSGSYLTILDGGYSSEHQQAERISNEQANPPYRLRSREELAQFFRGLELVEPGVVSAPRWRPEPDPAGPPAELDVFCGVARKP